MDVCRENTMLAGLVYTYCQKSELEHFLEYFFTRPNVYLEVGALHGHIPGKEGGRQV